MKGQHSALFCCLQRPFVHIFHFCKRKLFLPIVKVISIRAGRSRCDQRFVIPENLFIFQIEIIIAQFLSCKTVLPKGIVKCNIQMIKLSADFYDIPCMPILDAFLWIVSANGNHAPDPKGITQHFHRFCNPLTDSHTMS